MRQKYSPIAPRLAGRLPIACPADRRGKMDAIKWQNGMGAMLDANDA
ncbi:hypothetical protein ACLK1T_06770 [Escherichia coli]